ncbi:unnamed protein product [Gordionus sp. m RMFG-2023]
MLDFDDILPELGSFGRYQKLLITFICLPATLPCSFFGFLYIFQIAIPEHKCIKFSSYDKLDFNNSNLSLISINNCSATYQNQFNERINLKCIEWEFETNVFKSTAASKVKTNKKGLHYL